MKVSVKRLPYLFMESFCKIKRGEGDMMRDGSILFDAAEGKGIK